MTRDDAGRTPAQRKLLDAMEQAAEQGWECYEDEYGFTARFTTPERDVTHYGENFLRMHNDGRPTTTGRVLVKLTGGRPLVLTQRCGWLARSGGPTTFKAATAALADPHQALGLDP